jgi:polo-like kinase 4
MESGDPEILLPMSSINNYDIGRQLGKGGFAVVYHGRYRHSSKSTISSNNIAIKFINKKLTKEKEMISRVQNEIKIHSSLSHPSIVKLFHSFEDENFVYLILELCPHGTLFHYLKQRGPLNEQLTAKYCYQILSALEYLQQSHGIIHRDMKLSNLLLDENYNLKLCDFGLAVQLEHPDEEHFTICGTPNYIAPEIASQQSHGFPADIWSLGCLCYSMLTGGTLPFAHQGGVQETLKKIVAGEYAIPSHLQISQSALSFLGMILHVVRFLLPSLPPTPLLSRLH